jgi:glyoxylase-like metal-dependent hydrolase (beta-lactamase superfamily II)
MPPTKLHILHHGAMGCDLTWLLLKPGRNITDRYHMNQTVEWVDCPIHTVLIEHPDGLILWDTGAPRNWETHWAPTGLQNFFPYDRVTEEQYFDARLGQLGLKPENIRTVVLSHLHFDHAGNLQLFKSTGARILVQAAEKEGALGFQGPFKGAHIKADYEEVPLETVTGDTEIADGVSVLFTPGHTWGTMSLRVDLKNSGTMIFTSDAVYMRDAYGPPPVGAAIVWDSLAWLNSVEKIRSVAERTNATVVFGHDAQQIHELRRAPDAYYD